MYFGAYPGEHTLDLQRLVYGAPIPTGSRTCSLVVEFDGSDIGLNVTVGGAHSGTRTTVDYHETLCLRHHVRTTRSC